MRIQAIFRCTTFFLARKTNNSLSSQVRKQATLVCQVASANILQLLCLGSAVFLQK